MSAKFTSRTPKPRQPAVEPLQESPVKPADSQAGVPDKAAEKAAAKTPEKPPEKPKELGGPSGPEPTRYGDWERKGICVDF